MTRPRRRPVGLDPDVITDPDDPRLRDGMVEAFDELAERQRRRAGRVYRQRRIRWAHVLLVAVVLAFVVGVTATAAVFYTVIAVRGWR